MDTTHDNQAMLPPHNTRQTIEEKAISILAEKGYDATSMREIAAASSVSKPVIYYYFKSKENLCHSLIRSGLEDFRKQLEGICQSEAQDMFEQIVRAIAVHFEFCKKHVEFARFIYALNFGPDRHKIDYDFMSYGAKIFSLMKRLMERASEAGVVRRGKEEAAVIYLRGIINDFVTSYLDGGPDFSSDLAHTIATDMVNGLRPSSGKDTRLEQS
ncbi:TetR/AcrR family transcriptional regulator [Candidatus Poribacteria bacterium]|nr:TetR/AcrR family transcriptional regulator [Candidatus Poribacteria bacterium]